MLLDQTTTKFRKNVIRSIDRVPALLVPRLLGYFEQLGTGSIRLFQPVICCGKNEKKNIQNEFLIIGFFIDKYNFSPYHKTTTVDAA
jgi:hypothetical protein